MIDKMFHNTDLSNLNEWWDFLSAQLIQVLELGIILPVHVAPMVFISCRWWIIFAVAGRHRNDVDVVELRYTLTMIPQLLIWLALQSFLVVADFGTSQNSSILCAYKATHFGRLFICVHVFPFITCSITWIWMNPNKGCCTCEQFPWCFPFLSRPSFSSSKALYLIVIWPQVCTDQDVLASLARYRYGHVLHLILLNSHDTK